MTQKETELMHGVLQMPELKSISIYETLFTFWFERGRKKITKMISRLEIEKSKYNIFEWLVQEVRKGLGDE